MMEKGKLFPNWTVRDGEGNPRVLWDFRQRSHVILFVNPLDDEEERKRVVNAATLHRKTWDWLNVTFLWQTPVPEGAEPGVYLINRYGRLHQYFEAGGWTFELLEREWVYYEARHC